MSNVVSMKQLLEAEFTDIKQEDGTLRWQNLSLRKETVSTLSTFKRQ